jgi:hypothetical protein
MRTAVLKAVRSYLNERAAAGKSANERPQTPGADFRPQPSAPPAIQPSAPPAEEEDEEEEECGSARSIAVAECVVCMDGKVSVARRAEDCLWKI